jgi:predicted Zn finger-like uncharacterized protein
MTAGCCWPARGARANEVDQALQGATPMNEEKYTRCPACRTVFRVTDAQLALRGGMVRCGHCQAIFDGNAERISLAPQPIPDDAMDEAMQGPPTVTLRSARALTPAPAAAPAVAPAPPADAPARDGPTTTSREAPSTGVPTERSTIRTTRRGAVEAPVTRAPPMSNTRAREVARASAEPDIDYENRFAWDKPSARGARRTWPYAVGIPLLLVLFVGQAVYHFRDAIAAHWPGTKPALASMCRAAGCAVRPLRDVAALSIDASDLQLDPAHKGLLILTATVRNRAAYAIAYPYLELTLTDSQDQVVVRRAFAPSEYAGGTTDVTAGLPGNGEAPLKLFIDASATQQAGYRLYLFYP